MKRILGLLLVLYVPAASAVFRCVDDKGMTIFGDTPPAACGAHAPIYEIGPSGAVIRKIDPTPTAEEVKERAAEQERKKKAEIAAADQKRRDKALLASFGSPEEFDVARDRNIEPVTGRIASAQDRMKELDKREEEINTQLAGMKERAKNKDEFEPPGWLVANLDRVTKERTSLTTAIGRYKKEIDDLRAKFDGDKQRWIMLRNNGGVAPEASADLPKKDSKGY